MQESKIVITSLIFLCLSPLAPILKALDMGSFDFISLKPEPSAVLIFDTSVFLKRAAVFDFSPTVSFKSPDFSLSI